MIQDIRALEHEAFKAQRAGAYELAASYWQRILNEHDNWEHGYAHYYLADCYTQLGRLDEAKEEYRKAIRIEPNDTLFSEALSSLMEARKSGLL